MNNSLFLTGYHTQLTSQLQLQSDKGLHQGKSQTQSNKDLHQGKSQSQSKIKK